MKLLPLLLLLLATVAFCYGARNGNGRSNGANNRGRGNGNRRPGKSVQSPPALKSIAKEEEERKNCKMMHKSAAGDAPSAKVDQINAELNAQQSNQQAGRKQGRNRGRPAMEDQDGSVANAGGSSGGGRRRNGNNRGVQGGRRRQRPQKQNLKGKRGRKYRPTKPPRLEDDDEE